MTKVTQSVLDLCVSSLRTSFAYLLGCSNSNEWSHKFNSHTAQNFLTPRIKYFQPLRDHWTGDAFRLLGCSCHNAKQKEEKTKRAFWKPKWTQCAIFTRSFLRRTPQEIGVHFWIIFQALAQAVCRTGKTGESLQCEENGMCHYAGRSVLLCFNILLAVRVGWTHVWKSIWANL